MTSFLRGYFLGLLHRGWILKPIQANEKAAHSSTIQQVLQISLTWQWNGENLANSLHLVSNLLLRCWQPFSGEVAKSHTHGEGKSRKHRMKTEAVLWLLMIIDHVWLWAMLLCNSSEFYVSNTKKHVAALGRCTEIIFLLVYVVLF